MSPMSRLGQSALLALLMACGAAPAPTAPPSTSETPSPPVDPTPSATTTPQTPTALSPSPSPSLSPTESPASSATESPTPSPDISPSPSQPSPTPDAATATPTPSPTTDPRCQPALTLSPENVELATLSIFTFAPSGGTGSWRFELVENGSGAILNEVTGAYISGDVGGTRDRVRLWDQGCEGEAFADIDIKLPLSVRPKDARVTPGGQILFDIEEGSGAYQCTLTQGGSEPQLTEGCQYTAGDTPGYDQILVEDLGTQERAIIDIDVRDDAGPFLETESYFIPVGSRAPLRFEGGSGWIDATLDGEGLRVEEGILYADSPGAATLEVTDRYTGVGITARVHALPSLAKPLQWVGDRQMTARAFGPGDLNGDGHPDGVLAMPESDLAAYNGGAIFIYEGDGEGALMPTPARVILGDQWEGDLGRDLKVTDVDGDSLKDLVVGAPREDWGATDAGGVYIYRGIEGGFFEEEASVIIQGEAGSDWFGYGVASCDLDGDGWADLAIGAVRDQNNDIPGIPTDTGAVHLFLGGPQGFAPVADRVLYGVIPTDNEGGIIPWKDLRAGDGIEAGDLNGDGLCDLVVSAWQYDPPEDSNAGMVFAYLGREPGDGEAFGMGPNPEVSIESMSEGGEGAQLGRRIALGDFNQDGMDELLISHWYFDGEAGTRSGALRIFNGKEDFASLGWSAAEAADLSLEGDNSYDYMGFAMASGDLDGDGLPELMIGELQGETSEGPSSVGRVVAYSSGTGIRPGGLLGEYTLPEGNSSDFVGEAIAALVDDAGVGGGAMLVLAGRDDTYGYDVGRPYVMGEGFDPIPLDISGGAGGIHFGRGVAISGDRVAVGAPLDDPPTNGANDGTITLFDPESPTLPLQALMDFAGHSGSDQLGYVLSDGGDFNGDGRADLLAASLQEEAPSSFGADYHNPQGCESIGNNTGAAMVFLGQEGGDVSASPGFIYYGPQASTRISALAGNFDFNGDGLDDMAAASYDWDGRYSNIGGVSVLLGRATTDDAIEVLCDPALLVLGAEDNGQLGYSVTGTGDLNGDGCDDLALGGPFVDNDGLGNQGQVLILFGFGGQGCPAEPSGALLFAGVSNAHLGTGLSGGYDVDGDGVPDLAIGARNNQVGDDRPGSVFVVSGASLGALTPSPITSGEAMTLNTGVTLGAVDVIATLHGRVNGSQFGQSVALVPDLSGPGLAGVAVGEPLGAESGSTLTGGMRVYRFEDEGRAPISAALLIGEADHIDNRVGEMISGGLIDGRPMVAAGGYRGSGFGSDVGSVYVMDLSRASVEP